MHDNLRNLGLDVLDVVNLRSMLGAMDRPTARSKSRSPRWPNCSGKVCAPHRLEQRDAGPDRRRPPALPIACVQNMYNLAHRDDDALIDDLADDGHPLRAVLPARRLHSAAVNALSEVAAALGATPMQVALAWLLQRAPNILLIPGTSVDHLENLAAGRLRLDAVDLEVLGHLT